MSITFATKEYVADRFGPDSIGYFGPDHNAGDKDDLQISRVGPKPTSSFSGVSRASAKLTRSIGLEGVLTTVGEAIIQVNFSIPVGADPTALAEMVDDFQAFMALAVVDTLAIDAKISY